MATELKEKLGKVSSKLVKLITVFRKEYGLTREWMDQGLK